MFHTYSFFASSLSPSKPPPYQTCLLTTYYSALTQVDSKGHLHSESSLPFGSLGDDEVWTFHYITLLLSAFYYPKLT